MKFNFRKIASVLASVVMLGSTVGIAAAATTYPAPFVSGGAANVAIVYGSTAAFSDGLAAGDLQTNLQAELAKQTATGGSTSTGTITGESAPLFTSSSKTYVNSTLNSVKSTVTKTEMPVLLAETTFSGNVDAKTTQTIVLGSNPIVTYAKQPTSSDDPTLALTTSSSSGLYIYNATVDFSKAVNLSHADSKNQELTMFGKEFTIASATDYSNLVLLKSATGLNFDSSGTTSQEVTIEGVTYTVELVSASATTATVKVTNAAGASDQKEISEAASKKVNGLTIAVNTADTNNLKYTASIVAGSEKLTIPGSGTAGAITYGESDTVIDGVTGRITGGATSGTTGATKITVSVRAPNSDKDAIKPGTSFTDPVFGTFKVDFPGLNIADDSTTAREDIKIYNSGDDKMMLDMTDNNGNAKSFQWAINKTDLIYLQADQDGHNIHVAEMEPANKSDYIVIGNEDEGRLMKVLTITNQTTGYNNDKVTLQDVFSGVTIDATLTDEGIGTVTVGGKVYDVKYYGTSDMSDESRYIQLNYPDSVSDMIVYPTFQSSKGAKVFFYKPLTINLSAWDRINNSEAGSSLKGKNIKIPNGADSYQDILIGLTGNITITCPAGTTTVLNGSSPGNTTTCAITNTGLTYNFTIATGYNMTTLGLNNADGAMITDPALVVLEEKDDGNRYNANVIILEAGVTSDDGMGVSKVYRTWSSDVTWNAISLATDSKKTKEADRFGTIALLDSGDSDQVKATISYPDEQVYAQLYIGVTDSSVSVGTLGTGTVSELGSVIVKDSEVSGVSTKNLVVVGGSCINTVAAKILGSETPKCGADFTALVGDTKFTGANQALIKVVTSPYAADKVAMLVAGYEAADTTKAIKYITTSKPATGKDTKKILTTSTTVATEAV